LTEASDKPTARQPDHRLAAAVSLLTVLGLALRLTLFGDSLFGDELSSYYIVAGHSLGRVLHLLDYHTDELNPPLFFLLDWFSVKLFGLSAESLRLVSLITGTATVPLIYALGRRCVSVRAGVLGAFLVATCPFLIYYSTEARAYALMTFLVVVAALALLNALRTSQWSWWAVYAVTNCAAAYTHFTSIFVLAALALWALLTHPLAWRWIVGSLVLAVVGYLPYLPVLNKISSSPGTNLFQALEPLTLHSAAHELAHWAVGHPYVSLAQTPGLVAAALMIGGVGLGAVGAALRLQREGRGGRAYEGFALVILLAAAAPVGVLVYSMVRQSIWDSRNMISSWPAFGLGLAALGVASRGPLRVLTILLLVGGLGLADLSMLAVRVHRPDDQSVAAYLNRIDPRGGPVIELPTPSPGPPTAMEAALSLAGAATQHPDFRIGIPTLQSLVKAAPYALVPTPRGETIAREAAASAGRRPLFLVLPGPVPVSRLETLRNRHIHSTAGALGYLGSFLGALPSRLRFAGERTFPGLVPLTVYVLRG
jgi:hypothetical protein